MISVYSFLRSKYSSTKTYWISLEYSL